MPRRSSPGSCASTARSASPAGSPRASCGEREREPFTHQRPARRAVRAAIPAPARRTGGNPAKRTFQALRIEVNAELDVLRAALPAALSVLAPGGRIVVMSYHSLEDRIVKRALQPSTDPRSRTACRSIPEQLRPTARVLTRGSQKASEDEVLRNPRAASVRLRAVEKLAGNAGRSDEFVAHGWSPRAATPRRPDRPASIAHRPAGATGARDQRPGVRRGPGRPRPTRRPRRPAGPLRRPDPDLLAARTGSRGAARTRAPRHRLLVVASATLAIGLFAVLLINTIVSQGAFRQHELEVALILKAEQEEALARAVQAAEAPREVEKRARKLGMVPAGSPVFLRLSDGEILGEPVPAPTPTGKVSFAGAPGVQPTPRPSAGAPVPSATPGAVPLVDPALDPATGLDDPAAVAPTAAAPGAPAPTPAPGAPAATPAPAVTPAPAASPASPATAPTPQVTP